MTQRRGSTGPGGRRSALRAFGVRPWLPLAATASFCLAVEPDAPAAATTNAISEDAVVPAAEAALAATTPVTQARTWDVSGRLRAVYDYRSMGDDTDEDLYGYWYLNAKKLADGHLDLYASGRHRSDLNGAGTSYADDVYTSSSDSNGDQDTRLLQLYADLHDRDGDVSLRAGRQYIDAADYVQVDGAQLALFEPRAFGGRVFFGNPVSFYSPVSGDRFGGVSLTAKPWEGGDARLTYARYEDDSEDAADDNLFASVRQRVADALQMRAQASLMNGDFRMGGLDLWYFGVDRVSDVLLGVRHWGSYSADSRVYSPLYEVLGKSQPYTYLYARTTQEIAPWFLVSPGAAWQIMDPADEDAYNNSYGHYDVSFIFEPSRSIDASLAVEYWDVEDGDRFVGFSGEVRYRRARTWEIAGGAAYMDYQYRQYSDFSYTSVGGDIIVTEDGTTSRSSPDVFTYFARCKWRFTPHWMVRLQGDVEDDSMESDLAYRGRVSLERVF